MLTYFIADLHLSVAEPRLYQLFEAFLINKLKDGDCLYILGDLFALWIGDDDLSPFNRQVIKQLASLKGRGITVYLLLGNRDFLIKQRFATLAKLTLLPEKHVIVVADERILLLHGDTLCTLDHRYQAFRKRTQAPWLQWLFLHLPLWCRRRIATRLREQSHQARPERNAAMMDVVTHEVLVDCHEVKVQCMIHGHTHQPGVHFYYAPDALVKRYTLSDWGQEGNYLVIDEQGQKRLEYFA